MNRRVSKWRAFGDNFVEILMFVALAVPNWGTLIFGAI